MGTGRAGGRDQSLRTAVQRVGRARDQTEPLELGDLTAHRTFVDAEVLDDVRDTGGLVFEHGQPTAYAVGVSSA